jgi:mRNA-degrading endonuclease toxin of MazEF toxin-antitoxin module
VLTRNSAIAYLSTVTVAPVTSTIRGVPSEVVLNEEDGMKSPLRSKPAQRGHCISTEYLSSD